ncbi:MAG: hypothetical protein AB7W59_02200 [Acidimicrobiia bacterium]
MTSVDVSGPIFDGRAQAAAAEFVEDAKRDVAAQAYSEWMTNLNRSIRHPTPYYETQVTTTRRGADYVVHDRGIVYGPWLEGTSSRNRTTRFPGYFSARRATATLETKKTAIVQATLRRHIAKMG